MDPPSRREGEAFEGDLEKTPHCFALSLELVTPYRSPSQPFTTALEAEYPGHLAALVGETLKDWTQTNTDLTQRAWAGDDQAFFELIGRDPRVVGSELTVAKVASWRTELEGFAKYLNLKGSRLFPLTRLEQARAKMEAAKKNLRRLGQVHIAFFDQRRKKPLPPPGVVKGLCYERRAEVSGRARATAS